MCFGVQLAGDLRKGGAMPELPEVQVLAERIASACVGDRIARLDVVAVSALKTVSPGPADLHGATIRGCARAGKFLVLSATTAPATATTAPATATTAPATATTALPATSERELYVVIHLARAGWVKLSDRVPLAVTRPGRGPLVARLVTVTADGEPGACLDITEAGTRKSAALYVVADPREVPGLAALGPDAGEITPAALSELLHGAGSIRLKSLLRDQRTLAGIGNAYSDEILHAARLSPYRKADTLSAAETTRLAVSVKEVLANALERARQLRPDQLKDGKRSGLVVHGRAGEPCPVCDTSIAEVVLSDSSFQYCPTCQNRGRLLADRRMSRLLK